MLKWLQNCYYHTNLQIGIFILAGVLTFVTAFITVSYQAIKVAVSNPVKALRYE
jgi:putative ABC transport system permease protein